MNPDPDLRPDLRAALSGGCLALESDEIERLLPHRAPMLLVDRILALVPGSHAVGIKLVTGNEYGLLRRHRAFVFPSTLAFEALGQVAALALLYRPEPVAVPSQGVPSQGVPSQTASSEVVMLVAIERLEVHRELTCGEPLCLSVDVRRRRGPLAIVEGQATIQGEPFVEARFTLSVSRGPPGF